MFPRAEFEVRVGPLVPRSPKQEARGALVKGLLLLHLSHQGRRSFLEAGAGHR